MLGPAATRFPNGIAAIVNDTVITFGEVEAYTASAVDLLRRTYPPGIVEQKQNEAMSDGLQQLIEKHLILDDFKNSGGQLPESIIDASVKDRIRRQFGDRVTLTKTLQAQGVRFETYRKQTHDDIIVRFMQQKNVASAITISPTKIEHYYATNQQEFRVADQVKLRMITLNRSEGNSAEELLMLAREIVAKLDDGAPFHEMASIYSQDSYRREGGDRKWVERKGLLVGLAEIAFSLQRRQRSGVIGVSREDGTYWVAEYDRAGKTAFGRKYTDKDEFLEAKRFEAGSADLPRLEEAYLMLVEDRQDARVKSLAEVRDEIEQELIRRERARLHAKWIDRLKAKSFVVNYVF